MGIDRLDDDDDAAVVEHERRDVGADDVSGDHADARDVRDARADREEVDSEQGVVGETRDRATCYVELRAAVAAQYGNGAAADHSEARKGWDEAAPGFKQRSAEYEERLPSSERAPVDRSADEPGSWRGDGGQYLDPPTNEEVSRGCEQIRDTEETIVTPAMQRIEAEVPERRLVGFENRLKGQDRIKEKVAYEMEAQPNLTPEEALATVKDAIRYTFGYSEGHYTVGVQADAARLRQSGFELVELRNSWANEEYKGINSRWRVPEDGQLFEVQFHTQISFDAKQITHPAYERLRQPVVTKAEREEFEDFQRNVNAYIPIPPGAAEVPNVRRRS